MTRSSILASLHWLALAVVLLTTGSLRAQFAIYGMGSGGHESGPGVGPHVGSDGNGSFTAWGGTFGVYKDMIHLGPLRLGADGRFFIENSGNSTPYGNKLRGGLAGARLDAHLPLIPLIPYMQAEVGGAATNNGTSSDLSTGFTYQVQFGIDFTILPHLDLRGEYGVGQIFVESNNPTMQQFGGGLVLRL
jgi:hypothetical protein